MPNTIWKSSFFSSRTRRGEQTLETVTSWTRAQETAAMSQQVAASRLATLRKQLEVTDLSPVKDEGLNRQDTRGEVERERPAPGGGSGSLSVVDNRTGKKYEIKISDQGTIAGTELKKITAGGDGVGLRTYDPGCALLFCSCSRQGAHGTGCPQAGV